MSLSPSDLISDTQPTHMDMTDLPLETNAPALRDRSASPWRRWARAWQSPEDVLLLPGPPMDAVAGSVSVWPVPPWDAALLAWRQWCQAHAGQRVRLHLSMAWQLTGVVQTTEATGAAQAIDTMQLKWVHYLNLQADTLPRDWLLRATPAPGAWLVCAMPKALADDLHAVAGRHGVHVVWMGPWWVQGVQRWLRQQSWASDTHLASSLRMQEPGWCLHVQAARRQTPQLALTTWWLAPEDGGASSTTDKDTLVQLSRQGAGAMHANACVWDDSTTQRILRGRYP